MTTEILTLPHRTLCPGCGDPVVATSLPGGRYVLLDQEHPDGDDDGLGLVALDEQGHARALHGREAPLPGEAVHRMHTLGCCSQVTT